MDMLNYRIVQSITIYIGEVLLRSGRHSLRGSWSHLSNRLDRNYE